MRIILVIFLFLLQSFDIIFCDDGFVTIWAPKSLFNGGDYNVFYFPLGLNEQINAKLSVQFRRKNATVDLKNGEGLRIGFKNKASFNSRKKFDLFATLYREIKKNGDTIQQCVTRKLSVNSEKRKFYTFIQMDKPIYKPGDEVKFRILVLDRDMKPYHMNNIHINITDPFNRSIKVISDLGESFLGVFNSKFSLSSNTPLGNWKIKVVVDKIHQYENFKVFSVKKYTLPPFDVHISTERKAMLKTEDLKISFHAKFSFGEFVNGNAMLMIIDPKTGKQYLLESFKDVQGVKKVTYSIKNKLKITTSTKIDLEATLSFSEPESSYSVNKTIQFSVYGDSSRKIRPIHGDNFIPGLPFNIKVVAYEWNGDTFQEHSDKVEIIYTYKLKNNQNKIVNGNVQIVDGLATFNSIAPKSAVGLKIEVKFSNSKPYSKNIEQGAKSAGREEISVDYLPKKPKVNSKIQIFAKSTVELDTIIVIIMTRYGNSKSMQIKCESQLSCVFDVTVTKEMIPQSKIIVYCVKSREAIYYGSTILVSNEFGENYLDVSIPATSKTKEKVTMMFNTTDESEVFLLAYDKRLTYLQKGNDVRNEDVVESVGNFDNGSMVFTANLKNWKTCSADDIKRVESGAVTRTHSDDTIYADDIDDEEDELLRSEDEATTDQANEDSIKDEELRDNFPEAWIFDNFTVGEDEFIEKTFTVPDSITSWIISTFSINKNHGLAVASTKELIVKNEFFIDMILPYSIRFQEIFRLDILVYNYIDTKQQLEGNIELSSSGGKEFEFVEYQGDQPVFKNSKKQSKSVTVPHSTLKKVSFYIRRLPNNKKTEGFEKFMKIYVYGNAADKKGNMYKDKVGKKLRVEPAGVKVYQILNKVYELDGSRDQKHEISIGSLEQLAEDFAGFPKVSLVIAGDYLTDTINMDARFELYPTDDLEQKISKLKGNVEFFRYMLSTSKRPATSKYSDYYQSLLTQQSARWRFGAPAGYRAYFAEAIAAAMEIGALPANKRAIQKELDALKALQTEDGDFDKFGSFPDFLTTGREETAKFFQTSFILIPFLKLKGYITKSYKDVINKGFNYLNSMENRLETDNEGLAIAAYAYALNGQHDEALKLLTEINDDRLEISQKQKCLKISRSDSKCDIRHTSYAAIAYFTMNDRANAKPLINWLLESHNLNKYYSNTHSYAIATEAIAKLASSMRSDGTNFKVTLKNEADFIKVVDIEQKNRQNPVEVDFPEYSLLASMTTSGRGYCSITTIIERTVALGRTTPDFKVNIKSSAKKRNSNERIIKVCATYDPQGDQNLSFLKNVIYDVEMPSGYIYLTVVDYEVRAHDIKMVVPRQKGSRVIIYFNDFEQLNENCVEIQVRKAFDVRDAKDSGVKIYDYNDKQKVAIEFYSLN